MKKLLIDLEKCYKCQKCKAQCSYYYHPAYESPDMISDSTVDTSLSSGVPRLLALAAQEHVCRRCDNPPCVASCPWQALEQRKDTMLLDRYSMRCTSCKSCSVACPFGVIYPELVHYKTHQCDYCFDRSEDAPPLCVSTCEENALQWTEVTEDISKDIYAVRGGRYFVYTVKWKKEK